MFNTLGTIRLCVHEDVLFIRAATVNTSTSIVNVEQYFHTNQLIIYGTVTRTWKRYDRNVGEHFMTPI